MHADPVSRVFGAVSGFSEALELQDLVDNFTTHSAPGLLDDCRRSKQRFAIARGYMLCVKLLAILSEKLLESLLLRPAHTKSILVNTTHSAVTQHDGSIRPGLKLSDLYARSPNFKHALNNSTAVLGASSAILGKIERSLSLPPDLRGGVHLSENSNTESVNPDRSLPGEGQDLSLAARFIVSMSEDEAHTSDRPAITSFKRCRAAIFGLSSHQI